MEPIHEISTTESILTGLAYGFWAAAFIIFAIVVLEKAFKKAEKP